MNDNALPTSDGLAGRQGAASRCPANTYFDKRSTELTPTSAEPAEVSISTDRQVQHGLGVFKTIRSKKNSPDADEVAGRTFSTFIFAAFNFLVKLI